MKAVVISDIHLGIDDKIAENVKNRPLLMDFIERLRKEKKTDEIVINGDFLDQWFLPGTYEHEPDSDIFYRQIAKNNQDVMEAFQAVIRDGIRLVYVPGNHDMTLSHQTLVSILPGITQARDVRGLGRYRTGARGEIVIEHGHRYESFCAPDMFSNKAFMEYGEPILPPGYFFARIGVQSIVEGHPEVHKQIAELPLPDREDAYQVIRYAYYKVWKDVVEKIFPVKEDIGDKFIRVGIDGFQGQFSMKDIVPGAGSDGISQELYSDFGKHWEEVQRRNLVPHPVSLPEQLSRMTDQTLRAEYAKKQNFDLDPTVDVVVFGHTHVPFYQEFDGFDRKKIYVNEGTWVDHNSDDPENTAVFAEIVSDERETRVSLLKCVGDDRAEDIVPVKNQYVK